jgi:hypothetical protein
MVGDEVGRFFSERLLSRERSTSQWRERGGSRNACESVLW